ncbi:protein of unknown function [Methylocella tundrae]|uniref:Uncharacterized protein n=2 Tax=Methylocella tundrae TaxID=227605 RepID=A0A4U8YZF8_METTU|nr:protein of unknown function [Methylocella tundrae]
MTSEDYRRYPGAGVLFCRDEAGVPRKAAASWLIGSRRLVMMNAHIFRDPNAEATRTIDECFFQIAGRNYDFSSDSLELGVPDRAGSGCLNSFPRKISGVPPGCFR